MTLADWLALWTDQVLPFGGAFILAMWIRRDMRRAQHEIREMTDRVKQLHVKLSGANASEQDFTDIGLDVHSDEPLPLPVPLPPAIARYRP